MSTSQLPTLGQFGNDDLRLEQRQKAALREINRSNIGSRKNSHCRLFYEAVTRVQNCACRRNSSPTISFARSRIVTTPRVLAELGHSRLQNMPLIGNPNNLGKRSKPNSAALLHVFVWRWTMQTFCRILPQLHSLSALAPRWGCFFTARRRSLQGLGATRRWNWLCRHFGFAVA